MALRERRFPELVEFLVEFIDELNALSMEGAAVLVEGERDKRALAELGYTGRVLTKVALRPARMLTSLGGVKSVVILTDLDTEGRRLAGRYAELLVHSGVEVSLTERRRLGKASRGVFLHIENLVRFAPQVPETKGFRNMRV